MIVPIEQEFNKSHDMIMQTRQTLVTQILSFGNCLWCHF